MKINKENGVILLKCLYSTMITLNLVEDIPNGIFKQQIKNTGNKFKKSLEVYEDALYGLFSNNIFELLEVNQNSFRDLMEFQMTLSENQLKYFNKDLEKLKQKYNENNN